MNEEKIVMMFTDEIIPYNNNPRVNDGAVDAVAKSIEQFGFRSPIIVDKDHVIIAGHTRLKASQRLGLKAVPVIVAGDLTEEQANALRIVDNRTSDLAEWDFVKLKEELEGITLDTSAYHFDQLVQDLRQQADQLMEEEKPTDAERIEEDGFDVDQSLEEETDPIVKRGEIWKLGDHYLMCGDSTKWEDIEKLLNDGESPRRKVDLVFTDPPYGMGKEKDGVANDNLYGDKLLAFNKLWIPLSFKALKDNGSWYCWGIDEPLMDIYAFILKPMIKSNEITFRNMITWDKGSGQGQKTQERRMYSPADEKCLFVMCGQSDLGNDNIENYDEAFEPIRSYLECEAKKVGLTAKKLTEITGVQMYGHWFGKSQFTKIPRNHYEKLQSEYEGKAFKMPYDDLNNLFVRIMSNRASNRAYFDNTHDNMNNVWHFERAGQKERDLTGGHATPKPLALCARAIKSSSRPGETVLDLFGGSGSTLIACEQLGRKCLIMELEPKFCDVIIKRWETITGKKAEKEN